MIILNTKLPEYTLIMVKEGRKEGRKERMKERIITGTIPYDACSPQVTSPSSHS